MSINGEYLRVKNFEKYQHYSKRRPPWIKLYYALLTDSDFAPMTAASKLHTIAIMLLASQYDNKIPFNKKWIAQVIIANERINWDEILSSGFVICYQDASNVLADRKQHASTDTEVQIQKNRSTEVHIASHDENPSCSAVCTFTEIPCNGSSKTFQVANEYISEMRPLYPGVDIESETLRAKAWCINNPKKRKTHDGMPKFLNYWYSRAQNNGHDAGPKSPASQREESAKNVFQQLLDEQKNER